VDFLAKNITYLRKQTNKNQSDIGFAVNKGVSAVSAWEKKISTPGVKELQVLSNYFGISIDDLINTDLSNVHLNKTTVVSKKGANVHLNVHGNVHLNAKKQGNNELENTVEEPEIPLKKVAKLHRMPLIVTVDTSGRENVVFVPVKARAGYLDGSGDKEFIKSLPTYSLPGLKSGTFRMFEVDGLSMYPTLSSGDIVICSNVEQLQDVRDDRLHVIVTKNDGIVVKRVLNRLVKDSKLILKSDNYKDRELYPTIVCDPGDVLEVWYCTGFLSRQMRPPAETYNRLLDLEARFTLLEYEMKKQTHK
jgi:transcriptional regulator with XRE-family HTH domain